MDNELHKALSEVFDEGTEAKKLSDKVNNWIDENYEPGLEVFEEEVDTLKPEVFNGLMKHFAKKEKAQKWEKLVQIDQEDGATVLISWCPQLHKREDLVKIEVDGRGPALIEYRPVLANNRYLTYQKPKENNFELTYGP
jgi:hypothetical protein